MKIINIMLDQSTYDKLENLSDPDCLSFDKTVTQAINSLYESNNQPEEENEDDTN